MIKNKLMVIFLAAFLIRLIAINQSLWLDEGTTAKVAHLSVAHILTQFSPTDFHPPLYYFLIKAWTSLFSHSEIALRFPSILFSLLTGWVVFLIGSQLVSKKSAVWAVVFFLFNPLIVYYSQEARMYMMVTFLLTASLYFYLRLLKERTTKDVLLFNAFIFLSFATFYGSVFFILALYVYIIVAKKKRFLPFLVPGFFLAVLMLSPLLLAQLENAQKALSVVTNWKWVLGTASIKNTALIPIKFAFGRISFHPKILYYLLAAGWTVFVFCQATKGAMKHKRLLFLFLVPLVLGFFASFMTPLLQYFRFMYLVPILSLLLAIGAQKFWPRILLLFGFAALSLVYLTIPQFHREDWKSLSEAIPGDQKVFMILPSSDALTYYRHDLHLEDIRSLKKAKGQKQIVVLPYVVSLYGRSYEQELQELGFSRVKQKSFRELSMEAWRSR